MAITRTIFQDVTTGKLLATGQYKSELNRFTAETLKRYPSLSMYDRVTEQEYQENYTEENYQRVSSLYRIKSKGAK